MRLDPEQIAEQITWAGQDRANNGTPVTEHEWDRLGRFPVDKVVAEVQQREAEANGLLILDTDGEAYRFACGHPGFVGTQDGDLCFACWAEINTQYRRRHGIVRHAKRVRDTPKDRALAASVEARKKALDAFR